MKRNLRAFTLIELLSVIAIVGVLAAILIPAVSNVRSRARAAKKLSMYRQYHLANSMYAVDNDGYSCPVRDKKDSAQDWRFFLKPYLSDYAETKYQARRGEIYIDPFFEAYDPAKPWITGVGMNNQLRRPDLRNYPNEIDTSENPTSKGGRTILHMITYPNKRILIGDVTIGDARIYNEKRLETSRHEDGGMFVLFDGSVVFYTADEARLAFDNPAEL
ncbi:MAG: type II secretion system protein [Lentimonas sp.]